MALDELAPRRAARVVQAAPQLFEVSTQRAANGDALASERTAAQAAGYAAGWSSGMRAAKEVALVEADQARMAAEQAALARRSRTEHALRALDTAAQRLERTVAPQAEALTETILSAAYAIAEALVGHDLRTNPDRAAHTLANVLGLVPLHEDVTVRLSPADHATLTSEPVSVPTDRSVRLVADASLQPGDAIAVSGATQIDARIAAGLARVRESLGVAQ